MSSVNNLNNTETNVTASTTKAASEAAASNNLANNILVKIIADAQAKASKPASTYTFQTFKKLNHLEHCEAPIIPIIEAPAKADVPKIKHNIPQKIAQALSHSTAPMPLPQALQQMESRLAQRTNALSLRNFYEISDQLQPTLQKIRHAQHIGASHIYKKNAELKEGKAVIVFDSRNLEPLFDKLSEIFKTD